MLHPALGFPTGWIWLFQGSIQQSWRRHRLFWRQSWKVRKDLPGSLSTIGNFNAKSTPAESNRAVPTQCISATTTRQSPVDEYAL